MPNKIRYQCRHVNSGMAANPQGGERVATSFTFRRTGIGDDQAWINAATAEITISTFDRIAALAFEAGKFYDFAISESDTQGN